MKTTWKIVKGLSSFNPSLAIWFSGFRVGSVKAGRICTNIEAEAFGPDAFLVIAKWKKIEISVYRIQL